MLTFYGKGKDARIAMMRDEFVPVILDGYLRGTAYEREFLKKVALVGNGFTYMTVNGTKLGGDSYLGANGMGKALEQFRALPEEERKPKIERPADMGDRKGVPIEPPKNGLVANVFFTYLEPDGKGGLRKALWHVEGQPGTEPGSGAGRNQILTHVDKLWLTEAEWKSLLPANPTKGRKAAFPAALQQRFVRFYANDMAHRSTGDQVRSAEFSLTVEEATADRVTLRLEGKAETGVAFEGATLDGKESHAPGLCGADFRFLGTLSYDAKKGRFDRFDIAALGDGWGGNSKQAATTNFYRGGEHKRWPMGIAIELLTADRPIDRIPPQNANAYRCDSYFKVKSE